MGGKMKDQPLNLPDIIKGIDALGGKEKSRGRFSPRVNIGLFAF